MHQRSHRQSVTVPVLSLLVATLLLATACSDGTTPSDAATDTLDATSDVAVPPPDVAADVVVAHDAASDAVADVPTDAPADVVVTLRSIAVAPLTVTVIAGQTAQFSAVGTYSDGTTASLTTAVIWTSSDTTAATLDASGLASTLREGTATITASLGSVTSPPASLIATAAILTSIQVMPAATSVFVGGDQAFTARGTYSDGHTADVTAMCAWSSTPPGIATISAAGLAHGVAAGTAVIHATVVVSASVSVTGSASLAVESPDPVSIAVMPATATIAAGDSMPFVAIMTFSDRSTRDVTASVGWTSSAPAVATVDASGRVHARAAGTVTVRAALSSLSGTATVTVSPAALRSLVVTPATATVRIGASRQLTATATYSDGAMRDATRLAGWSSGDPTSASVDASGLVTALAQNARVTITASLGALNATAAIAVAP